jgi:hypothetical protein
VYETGEWPKVVTEVTVIALEKKAKSTECSQHSIMEFIAHTARIVVTLHRRKMERKVVDVLVEDHFGFRRGNENMYAIRGLPIISERTLNIDEELCYVLHSPTEVI